MCIKSVDFHSTSIKDVDKKNTCIKKCLYSQALKNKLTIIFNLGNKAI